MFDDSFSFILATFFRCPLFLLLHSLWGGPTLLETTRKDTHTHRDTHSVCVKETKSNCNGRTQVKRQEKEEEEVKSEGSKWNKLHLQVRQRTSNLKRDNVVWTQGRHISGKKRCYEKERKHKGTKVIAFH